MSRGVAAETRLSNHSLLFSYMAQRPSVTAEEQDAILDSEPCFSRVIPSNFGNRCAPGVFQRFTHQKITRTYLEPCGIRFPDHYIDYHSFRWIRAFVDRYPNIGKPDLY